MNIKASRTFIPHRIISGGQTGADRGGLEAGIALGVPIGGYVAQGRKAEDGRVPDKYPLVELVSSSYSVRTRVNIESSDVTFIFVKTVITPGSIQTRNYAYQRGQPYVVFDLDHPYIKNLDLLRDRLNTFRPLTLNIAGSRESKAPGIEVAVRDLLIEAMRG
jgi:hypothetical protein